MPVPVKRIYVRRSDILPTPSVKVRDLGPPIGVGSLGTPRLDIATDVGVILNGTRIAALTDQSPYGNDALKFHSAIKQPQLVSLANGPGALFGGTDGNLRIAAMNFGGVSQITGAIVLHQVQSTYNSIIVEGPPDGTQSFFSIYINTTLPRQVEVRVAGQNFENGGYFIDRLETPKILIFTIDRTITGAPGVLEMQAWLNGEKKGLIQIATSNPGSAFGDVALNFGSRDGGRALGWNGVLQHVRLYPRLLSEKEIGILHAYLAKRWLTLLPGLPSLEGTAPANGSFTGVIFNTQAEAAAVRSAINSILGYPRVNTVYGPGPHRDPGITRDYSYLRKEDVSERRMLVVDSVVDALHGQSYGGVLIDTSAKQALDGHTWSTNTDWID